MATPQISWCNFFLAKHRVFFYTRLFGGSISNEIKKKKNYLLFIFKYYYNKKVITSCEFQNKVNEQKQ